MKGGDLEGSDVLERVFEAIDVDSDQRVTFGEFHEFLSQDTGAKKLIFRPGEKMWPFTFLQISRWKDFLSRNTSRNLGPVFIRSNHSSFKLNNPDEEILPSNGMVMIIPANRYHSAVYNGKIDRVMIGVNFYSLQ